MSDKPLSDRAPSDAASGEDLTQLRRLQAWWLELPLSYRVNALLYLLGACFLFFLLTAVLSGGSKPRQIQVGAGAVVTSTSTTKPKAFTPLPTAVPGSSSSTAPGGTTTTTRPGATTTTVAGAAGVGGGGGGSTATGGGGGGGSTAAGGGGSTVDGSGGGGGGGSGGGGSGGGDTGGGSPPPDSGGGGGGGGSDTSTTTTPPTTTTTAPGPPVCRNSTDARCGTFRWDPPPTNRAPVIDAITSDATLPVPGQIVHFKVKVTEPDHALGNACATMAFGDGMSQGNCPPPPCGPTRYGPWDTPAPGGPGSFEFTFDHGYPTQPGPRAYTITFTMESRSDCYDPYGTPLNDPSGTKTASIVVTVGS